MRPRVQAAVDQLKNSARQFKRPGAEEERCNLMIVDSICIQRGSGDLSGASVYVPLNSMNMQAQQMSQRPMHEEGRQCRRRRRASHRRQLLRRAYHLCVTRRFA